GPGVVALQGDALVGFLGAFPIPGFRGFPAVISPEWGNGAPADDDGQITEAMYAALAPAWVSEGRTVHLVATFANDHAGIAAWHMLGFGGAAGDAVRGLEPVTEPAVDVTIRRATWEDVEAVLRLERALVDHLAASPAYLCGHAPSTRDDIAALLADEAYAVWLGLQDGEAVAYLLMGPASEGACTIIRDPGTCSITGAYTEPAVRGTGIGTGLLNRGLAWAQGKGYVRCAVDFETMNPPARRFWLRHFTPVTYALERHVDRRAVGDVGSVVRREPPP
ncbi:MAG: GNAT family N-acetyltransferase, partial [Anaerolineae bacterium]|nr:GNAT family N-acetyltransferase [Anaerolineae bacterium]